MKIIRLLAAIILAFSLFSGTTQDLMKFQTHTLLQSQTRLTHWNWTFLQYPLCPLEPLPSDTWRIMLTTNTFLMVDIAGCLTVGYGMRCGKLYVSNGESNPSVFKYDRYRDTLEYIYNGREERLQYGKFCLIALTKDDESCGVSDCKNIYIVRTDENSCRDYPDSKRFNLTIDQSTNTVVIAVSSNTNAVNPVLLIRDTHLPDVNEVKECLEVGIKEPNSTTGQWRFLRNVDGIIVLGFSYVPYGGPVGGLDPTKLYILESVATTKEEFTNGGNSVFKQGKGVGKFLNKFAAHSGLILALPDDEANLLYYNEKILIKLAFFNGQNSSDGYLATWNYDGTLIKFSSSLCDCTNFNQFKLELCPDPGMYRVKLVGCSGEYIYVNESRNLDVYPSNFDFHDPPYTDKEACFRLYEQSVNTNDPAKRSMRAYELPKTADELRSRIAQFENRKRSILENRLSNRIHLDRSETQNNHSHEQIAPHHTSDPHINAIEEKMSHLSKHKKLSKRKETVHKVPHLFTREELIKKEELLKLRLANE